MGCIYYTARSNALCRNRVACLSSKPSESSRISTLSLSTTRYERTSSTKMRWNGMHDTRSSTRASLADTSPLTSPVQKLPSQKHNSRREVPICLGVCVSSTACVQKPFEYRQHLASHYLQATNSSTYSEHLRDTVGRAHLPFPSKHICFSSQSQSERAKRTEDERRDETRHAG
jgi:hypothetical protein